MKLYLVILTIFCTTSAYSQIQPYSFIQKYQPDTVKLSSTPTYFFSQSYKLPFFCNLEHQYGIKFKVMPCFRLGTLEASNSFEYSTSRYYKK